MIWDMVPFWLQYLIQGLGLFTVMTFSAIVITRMGRNPYWALLSVVPFVPVIGIWLLALTRWPSIAAKVSPSSPEQ